MAPMRDLICGGCDVDVCDMASFSPLRYACAERLLVSRQYFACCGNLPRLRGPTNPENADRAGFWRTVFQALPCTEGFSHCRNAWSFGGSALVSGETR